MENKIKKVFVKNEKDEKYLVVVRESEKESYNGDKVEKNYDEVVEELLFSHDLEEKDYTKLFDMGIIQEVEEDLISEIVYYDDDSKFVVKYYSGKTEEFLSDEELVKMGLNLSSTHVDFMFGTDDLNIEAETNEGKKLIFKNGDFNI